MPEGVKNLLEIYRAVTECSPDELYLKFEGKSYKYLKDEVTKVLIDELVPFQERFVALGGKLNTKGAVCE